MGFEARRSLLLTFRIYRMDLGQYQCTRLASKCEDCNETELSPAAAQCGDRTNASRFKRMSVERFGTVDIDGLWNLRNTKGGDREHPQFRDFDERADVTLVGEQEKCYAVVRTEYLASNPTEVPEVAEIIRSCTRATSDNLSSQKPPRTSTHDPFHALSPELRMMLLEILEWQDIASLSMSSRIFSQLPQTFLKQLLRKEMPWVWELDDIGSEGLVTGDVDWLALYDRLHTADGGTCSDEKARAEGNRSHTLNRDLEIRGLRNRRMIYRDIGIVLDMIAEAKAEREG
jgi:hypothetical protein